MVLPDVSIADHAVVGAQSVVTQNVPAFTVVAGNPARVLREQINNGDSVKVPVSIIVPIKTKRPIWAVA